VSVRTNYSVRLEADPHKLTRITRTSQRKCRMKLQVLLLLLLLVTSSLLTTATDSCTNPLEWTKAQNSYSASEYADHRTQCNSKCNAAGHCCTLGVGGCNHVPCTTGCHIAWFSDDLAACKAECDRANSMTDCEVSYQLNIFHCTFMFTFSLTQ
jgi:hypothetical protein